MTPYGSSDVLSVPVFSVCLSPMLCVSPSIAMSFLLVSDRRPAVQQATCGCLLPLQPVCRVLQCACMPARLAPLCLHWQVSGVCLNPPQRRGHACPTLQWTSVLACVEPLRQLTCHGTQYLFSSMLGAHYYKPGGRSHTQVVDYCCTVAEARRAKQALQALSKEYFSM